MGDCLPFGFNGLSASQAMDNACGKMLLLDPVVPGSSAIVTKGIRNSQQMNIEGTDLVFVDIGGVVVEEVNVVPLADLLDTFVVENFGWGMDGRTLFGVEYGRKGEVSDSLSFLLMSFQLVVHRWRPVNPHISIMPHTRDSSDATDLVPYLFAWPVETASELEFQLSTAMCCS